MKKIPWVLAFIVMSAGLHTVRADDTVNVTGDALIAGRQAGMDLQLALVGSMKRAIEAKADIKPFKDAGEGIAAWGKAIPGLFPAGTDHGHKTRALPVIWSDRAGFEKAAADLTTAAETLAKTAEAGDQTAFAAALQATGQACGACHRGNRAK